jgi:hypothetical protein
LIIAAQTENEKLQHFVAVIGISAAAFVMIIGTLFVYWFYFDTQPPFTATNVYTMNEKGEKTDTFHAGDTMLVYRDLCFERDLPVMIGRSLRRIDAPELNVAINTTSNQIRKGCTHNSNVLQIPVQTPPGKYHFEATVRYSNNPFQESSVLWPSPVINIVP